VCHRQLHVLKRQSINETRQWCRFARRVHNANHHRTCATRQHNIGRPSPNMLKTGAPARSREALAISYQRQRMSLVLPSAILHGTRNPFTSETKKDRPCEGVLGNRPSRLECARPTSSLRWPTLRGGEDEASPTDQMNGKTQLTHKALMNAHTDVHEISPMPEVKKWQRILLRT